MEVEATGLLPNIYMYRQRDGWTDESCSHCMIDDIILLSILFHK